jgi:hemoglobin
MNPTFTPVPAAPRHTEPNETNIRELVYAFYDRVRADSILGPVFEQTLAGRWDEHLPKMCTFWASLVLGAKQYRGNVQQAHQPLLGLEPQHFSHWLYLFLDTVESRYEPAAAIRFMEPALRIAQSLQLGGITPFPPSSRTCSTVSHPRGVSARKAIRQRTKRPNRAVNRFRRRSLAARMTPS